jgi:hypothetical protein
MASVVDIVLVGAVLGIHTLFAAVLTRFFRIRLDTDWGAAVYVALLVPLALLVTTLVFAGVMGIGSGFELNRALVLGLFVGMPTVLGATVDVLYMTPPEEYELPEPAEN